MVGSCWDDVNWALNAGFLQASGGTILGVPRLDVPGGAYRSPQSGTYSLEEAGSKKSTPAGLLQGKEQGDSGSEDSETFEIGGDAKAKWKPLPICNSAASCTTVSVYKFMQQLSSRWELAVSVWHV